ncbi:unnamed protein product [Dovyalis caffra]|uniref:Uncharacterized protein n=1 Tax=Dovyalis caffra TaxID=77055 RepID=A0AAV1R5I2_9ROSI|nr:unnamed protein product [Dovyalis caffra]
MRIYGFNFRKKEREDGGRRKDLRINDSTKTKANEGEQEGNLKERVIEEIVKNEFDNSATDGILDDACSYNLRSSEANPCKGPCLQAVHRAINSNEWRDIQVSDA